MSILEEHRAAVVSMLASVPDIGQVHDRERYAANEAAFRGLYLFTPSNGPEQLRGWWLRRTETLERTVDTAGAVNAHTWTVRGYLAFNDLQGTELVLDDLVEQFRTLVRDDPTFGGVCQPGPLGEEPDGVQVADAGAVMFAGVMCHSVVLTLQTWSYL